MEIMNMKLKMMATLWDNTYRVAIDDGQGKYIGTARVVVNVPLPPEMLTRKCTSSRTTVIGFSRRF